MGNKSARAPEADSHPSEERAPTQEELSYFQMAKIGYEQLVHAIIRPPRCQYSPRHLGPPNFSFCGRQIRRRDFELHNMRDMLLSCSLWEPENRDRESMPCVIYMHGNSSARVEALPQLTLALALGCTFLAFDFAGSGLSEGQYVSLGFFERDDLQVVIEYLRGTGTTSSIALWGRSMGAATALMHGERDPSIGAMILDSAFADLTMLAESMVEKGKEQGYSVPSFVVKLAIRFIRSSVLKIAHFDIKELSPIRHVANCYIPALFVAGGGDNFVPPTHSQLLHDGYSGEKSIHVVDGDHNTPRPADFFEIAAVFLITALSIPESKISQEGLACAGNGMGAWTVGKRLARVQSMAPMSSNVVTGEPMSKSTSNNTDGHNVSFDELLAISLMEGDLDMGMTPERQAEMQRSLMAMLGDRRQLDQPVTVPKTSRSIKLSADVPPPIAPDAVILPPSPPDGAGMSSSLLSSMSAHENGNFDKLSNSNHFVSENELNNWVCALCTLANHNFSEYCEACDTARP